MSVPLKPLSDYIVAQAEVAATKTASGLFLPDNAQEKPKSAKIVAVGPTTTQLKVGDRIVYKSYTPTEVKIEGEQYILIKEEDVMATVN